MRRQLLHVLTILFVILLIGCSKDSEQPLFSFGVITDVQYCDCEPYLTRYFRSSLKKFEECVQQLNFMNLAFTIQLGDLIDRDFESFDKVLPILQKLNMPTYHVLGNHEFSVASEKKDAVLPTLGLKNGYYDFAMKGWRFVVLDGNDIHLKRTPKGSEPYQFAKQMYDELQKQNLANAQQWNGALSEKQMQWLKNTLDTACQSGEHVVLFNHFPVYPRSMHSLWNDIEVMNLIESYDCVAAYLNGHDHNGYYEEKNGIHYLNLKGMVETPEENSYAVIEVYPTHLNVIGYGREPDRVLSLEQVAAVSN